MIIGVCQFSSHGDGRRLVQLSRVTTRFLVFVQRVDLFLYIFPEGVMERVPRMNCICIVNEEKTV